MAIFQKRDLFVFTISFYYTRNIFWNEDINMIKLNKLITFIFLSTSIFMSSCTNEQDRSTQELNEKLEQLRVDYFNQVVINGEFKNNVILEDVKINEFYGNYEDSYVASFFIKGYGGGGGWGAIKYYSIDGVDITFHEWIEPIVWKDGTIYEFEDSYQKGLLTKEDLLTIVNVIEEKEQKNA